MAPQDGTAVWGGGSGGRGAAGGASLPDRGHRATTMPKISGELACSGTLTVSSGTWDLGPGTWAPGPGTWDLGPGSARHRVLLVRAQHKDLEGLQGEVQGHREVSR